MFNVGRPEKYRYKLCFDKSLNYYFDYLLSLFNSLATINPIAVTRAIPIPAFHKTDSPERIFSSFKWL